jgi:hypothetical protein
MDRKTFTIVMAIALIASFFLPLFSVGGSAFDMVKGGMPGWEKYLWLAFPICGLLLLFGELGNNYVLSRSFLTWLPLLVILFFLFIAPLIDKVPFGDIFKTLGKGYGVGMWLAIVSSLVLAFYNPRPR